MMRLDKPHSHKRLRTDLVGWLTTVSDTGKPSTAPVWFIVEDDNSILVFSKDPSVRVRNIEANPKVTFALNSDAMAHDVVVLNGTAHIERSMPPASEHAAFLAKYREALDGYNWSPQWFAEHYPAPIVITVDSIRGR